MATTILSHHYQLAWSELSGPAQQRGRVVGGRAEEVGLTAGNLWAKPFGALPRSDV